MADWPTGDDLKLRLNIPESDEAWDDHMDRLVAAATEWVKAKVGNWDDGLDDPDDALAQAALERAVETATNGEEAPSVKSTALLFGHRRRFGIA